MLLQKITSFIIQWCRPFHNDEETVPNISKICVPVIFDMAAQVKTQV